MFAIDQMLVQNGLLIAIGFGVLAIGENDTIKGIFKFFSFGALLAVGIPFVVWALSHAR